jgi:hypothetical protein
MMSSKDILAKLLATENLTVNHDKVSTASFDVKQRVLTLPIWDNMESFTYDHLVGHEVGHALYTPEEGWQDIVSENDPAYKSYVNVIEDARIEKLIQRKYPGLRREFIKSYKKMLKDGFFGDDIEGINRLGLIDRINTYFKLGRSSGVRIEPEELVWVNEIGSATTWEQVVDIANRMYSKAQEDAENQEQHLQELVAEESDSEPTEGMGSPLDTEDEDGDEDHDGETGGWGESLGDILDGDDDEVIGDDLISKTDESLRNRIKKEMGDDVNGAVYNLTNNYYNPKTVSDSIVGYKKVLEDFADMNDQSVFGRMYDWEEKGNFHYESFKRNNKKTINYLVKEFEMKKSASAYSRATTSKTGVIDPVLLNTYRYNDDIFKKVTNLPEGKDHGMIMYLDWSGSMARDLYNTVEQTLNLVHFCRQVQIPFRVYAFTNRYEETVNYRELANSTETYNLFPESRFRLLEFFNSKMNGQQINRMTKVLLTLAAYMNNVRNNYNLGGTPLDDTLGMAPAVYDMFQKENRVDIVNTIFLTDGDSHSSHFLTKHPSKDNDGNMPWTLSRILCTYFTGEENIVSITDSVTKKRYRVFGGKVTKTLLEMYSDRTGSNVIGFRIMPAQRNQMVHILSGLSITTDEVYRLLTGLKKENYTNIPGQGYDKFFAIKGGAGLKTSNGVFEVASDAKKGQISNAFKKANKSKLVSRTMLNEFIKEIA